MKTHLAATLLAIVPLIAAADEDGFVDPSRSARTDGSRQTVVTTVAAAKAARDDTPVVLRGRIERKLGHDTYRFRDATGAITLDIDDDDWEERTVTPRDTVQIEGEVDKDRKSIEIDVDTITRLP
ncbi:MAG: NirD/YgiW/YdeI family stress tolerance protein [Rhodocyclaceae bacterium]